MTEVGTVDNEEVEPAYLEALVLTAALCALLLVAASVTFLVEVVKDRKESLLKLDVSMCIAFKNRNGLCRAFVSIT